MPETAGARKTTTNRLTSGSRRGRGPLRENILLLHYCSDPLTGQRCGSVDQLYKKALISTIIWYYEAKCSLESIDNEVKSKVEMVTNMKYRINVKSPLLARFLPLIRLPPGLQSRVIAITNTSVIL